MKLKIATSQYSIGEPGDFAAFAARVGDRVAQAARAGAGLVVLPEYLSLEAAAGQPVDVRADFARSLAALQAHRDDYVALARDLALRHSIYLVAGTFLLDVGGGHYRNRAYFASPDGKVAFQDKLTLTGFERASIVIEPGDALKVFDTEFGRVGIDVCYDCEFPLYARAQVEAGARVILVPSCTDTDAGANRVRLGCQARAMENQVYVACAVTAGEAPVESRARRQYRYRGDLHADRSWVSIRRRTRACRIRCGLGDRRRRSRRARCIQARCASRECERLDGAVAADGRECAR